MTLARLLRTLITFSTALIAWAPNVAAQTANAGPAEVIYDVTARNALGLSFWPDGNIGVIPASTPGQFSFYAANGPRPLRAVGSLQRPVGSGQSVTIHSQNRDVAYLAGGPVFADSSSGKLLMFYHAEYQQRGFQNFYAVLGLAIQDDQQGLSFTDVGLILQPNVSFAETTHAIDMLGAPFITKDGYFYVYFSDTQSNDVANGLAVARAPVADVIQSALRGQATAWTKYYNGAWSQPGLGGRSSPLESPNQYISWMDIKWNAYVNTFAMVSARPAAGSATNIFVSTSVDGLRWSTPQRLDFGGGESFYPTIIGSGRDATTIGRSFYVYYTSSALGAFQRWQDAAVVRRLVTFEQNDAWNASVDCVLNWVERSFPQLLRPAGATTQALPPYLYRFYPGTNAYLGVATDDTHLYYLAPAAPAGLFDAGAVAPWFQTSACS